MLLFRELFKDISSAVLVDPFAYEAFNRFANEVLTGTLYRLPEALRLINLSNYNDLKFI